MAVGPFDPAAFCVTGGAGVAKDLVCIRRDWRAGVVEFEAAALAALRESCAMDCRATMLMYTHFVLWFPFPGAIGVRVSLIVHYSSSWWNVSGIL